MRVIHIFVNRTRQQAAQEIQAPLPSTPKKPCIFLYSFDQTLESSPNPPRNPPTSSINKHNRNINNFNKEINSNE